MKNLLNQENLEKGIVLASKAGDFVENAIGTAISESSLEAPLLPAQPKLRTWYRLPLAAGMSGDGSEYHTYLARGSSDHLCIFFSGGGVAWNEYTAARPVTGGKVASGQPNFYWNNLRPFTQVMNIRLGITELRNPTNPFRDWNFLIITYATGDLHVGDNDYEYTAEDGTRQVLHFHGYRNFRACMDFAKGFFPDPDKILIAGNSAGAFAVPALAGDVLEDYYPDCPDYTLLSDSGQLLYDDWQKTARDIWKASDRRWQALTSDNITLDWYRDLVKRYPGRFRCLYASSVYDYILSAYYNDVTNKVYKTDTEVQKRFRKQLVGMVKSLHKIDPQMGFYLYNWRIPGVTQGGTVHTAVREMQFTTRRVDSVTMAKWLSDAVDGKVYHVGLKLLKKEQS